MKLFKNKITGEIILGYKRATSRADKIDGVSLVGPKGTPPTLSIRRGEFPTGLWSLCGNKIRIKLSRTFKGNKSVIQTDHHIFFTNEEKRSVYYFPTSDYKSSHISTASFSVFRDHLMTNSTKSGYVEFKNK